MARPEEIDGVLAILSAAYPMFQIPEDTIELYAKELADVPAVELVDAAEEHIKRCRFFPTIAELRGVFDEKQVSALREEKRRRWKERREEYKREALSPGEAAKYLKAINERADVALVPSRRTGMSRLVKQQPDREVGANCSAEEWQERKRKMKERLGAA